MTPKQDALYWREWAAARAERRNIDRHELHEQALGEDKSHKDFTNSDFDKVLAVFRAISQPANLLMQMRQQDQPKRRLIYGIQHLAPEAYTSSVALDKFGECDLEELTIEQLRQLRMTLQARAKAMTRQHLAFNRHH